MFLLETLQKHKDLGRFKPFLVSHEDGLTRQFSYGDAFDETRRWADILSRNLVQKGDIVFLALKHRHEIYFGFLGAMWLGAIPAIIPFPTPKQDMDIYWREYRAMFAQVNPRLLVTYADNIPAIRDALAKQPCTILDIDDRSLVSATALSELKPVCGALNDTALLQFSSGTTGLRKGVMLSHGQLLQHMVAYSQAIGFSSKDIVASWLPLYHDMGLIACFLLPLYAGATIVSLDAFEWVAQPWKLLQALDTYRATFAWMPNFALQHVVRTLPGDLVFDLQHVRAVINCSEVCRPQTAQTFLDTMRSHGLRAEQLQTCYGMAEAVFAISQSSLETSPRSVTVDRYLLERFSRARIVDPYYRNGQTFLSCGHVLESVQLRIVPLAPADEVLSSTLDAAPGDIDVGEIQIRGGYLFSGYFRNDDATRAAMTDGWYKTGDIGFIEAEELFICGRLKEILIVHGRNYYANDIEGIVSQVDGIKPGRAVAFSIEDADSDSEEVILLAESDATAGETRTSIQRAVKTAVFNRMELTLRSVLLVAPGTLIKTTSGKLCRETNKTRYLHAESMKA
ncbi:AMP-binding protein [Dyella tabacisoli]|nr:AMP-binding protein [Dyella tabacisoli]